jgi:hypothetical protein
MPDQAQAEQELTRLSAKLFKLEETAGACEADRKALVGCLADDFLIRRGKGAQLDREKYEKDPPKPGTRRAVDEMVTVTPSGAVGVVTCRLQFNGTDWLWNTQMFEKRGGGWKCILWQVRPIEPRQFAPCGAGAATQT